MPFVLATHIRSLIEDIILDALSVLRAPLIKSVTVSFTRMAIRSSDKFECRSVLRGSKPDWVLFSISTYNP